MRKDLITSEELLKEATEYVAKNGGKPEMLKLFKLSAQYYNGNYQVTAESARRDGFNGYAIVLEKDGKSKVLCRVQ